MPEQYHIAYRVIKDNERRFDAKIGYYESWDGRDNCWRPTIFPNINQAYRIARGWELHWQRYSVELEAYVNEV